MQRLRIFAPRACGPGSYSQGERQQTDLLPEIAKKAFKLTF